MKPKSVGPQNKQGSRAGSSVPGKGASRRLLCPQEGCFMKAPPSPGRVLHEGTRKTSSCSGRAGRLGVGVRKPKTATETAAGCACWPEGEGLCTQWTSSIQPTHRKESLPPSLLRCLEWLSSHLRLIRTRLAHGCQPGLVRDTPLGTPVYGACLSPVTLGVSFSVAYRRRPPGAEPCDCYQLFVFIMTFTCLPGFNYQLYASHPVWTRIWPCASHWLSTGNTTINKTPPPFLKTVRKTSTLLMGTSGRSLPRGRNFDPGLGWTKRKTETGC